MNNPLFIGIDIGTQGTKAVLCDKFGKVIKEAFVKSKLFQHDNVTAYENPEDIFSSVITTIKELTKNTEDAKNITGICMDAQMAGIMAIDDNFEAATPLDSWLDSRCSKYTKIIKEEVGDKAIEKSGGQIIHSHASKILWWKNEQPDIYKKISKFVQPNGYVAGKLCGLSAKDAFMDYTFLHFNVFSDNKNLCFNEELLKRFGVSPKKLPKIVSPTDIIGTVTPKYAKLCGLPENVKVLAGCGDTAASSLGAGITEKGLAYDVAGTASVFACCTDKFVPDVEHKTLLFSRSIIDGLFLPLSYIGGGGLCLPWFANMTGKSLKELDSEVKEKNCTATPLFIPHFSGRTFPLDDKVSGAFLELNPRCDYVSMYKSIMEGIAFEYDSYFRILKDTNCVSPDVTVIGVGGGSKSEVFSQIKADVLGVKYITPKTVDSAPTCCAVLAAFATGYIEESIKDLFSVNQENSSVYIPDAERHQYYKPISKKYLEILNEYGNFITK